MRVLVLGGHGWIGRALVPALRRRGHVVLAPRRAECDIADARAVQRTLSASRARGVVNAAAANSGERDEGLLAAVNVEGARNVASAAAKAGARLVHVSTDLVLDGRAPPYRDDAPARPVNAYGRSKAAGERAVREACPSAVPVRASHVYDLRTPDPSLHGFAERLARGEPCRLFTDEVRCPIERRALASALAELVETDVAGTLNVAGAEPISRFEYGTLLLEWFRVPGRERVERALAAGLADPRPLDLTLDVSKARALLATPLLGVRATLERAGARRRRGGSVRRSARPARRRAPRSR
jgi:dTDP-4-dehydrorhamnose reductase